MKGSKAQSLQKGTENNYNLLQTFDSSKLQLCGSTNPKKGNRFFRGNNQERLQLTYCNE